MLGGHGLDDFPAPHIIPGDAFGHGGVDGFAKFQAVDMHVSDRDGSCRISRQHDVEDVEGLTWPLGISCDGVSAAGWLMLVVWGARLIHSNKKNQFVINVQN